MTECRFDSDRPHPELANSDGALGLWKALDAASPNTRHQRCAAHETVDVMDKRTKSVQPTAKADLREVWAAPDRATAEAAIAMSAEKYGAKYEKAVAYSVKDQDALLTFTVRRRMRWPRNQVVF